MDVRYFSGLDLGQSQDFTALAILEQTMLPDPDKPGQNVRHYAVRHLERFPLGTSYTAILRPARDAVPRLEPLARTTLAVDQTGVGRPVIDMLNRSPIDASIRPITITGGHKASPNLGGGHLVPKKELVSVLQVMLQARRIKVAPTLPEAATLVRELTTFQVKITPAANEVFGAWREGQHDDLVLGCRDRGMAGGAFVGGVGNLARSVGYFPSNGIDMKLRGPQRTTPAWVVHPKIELVRPERYRS